MNCENCNTFNKSESTICEKCGQSLKQEVPIWMQASDTAVNIKDETKIYKTLSYVFILWGVGMFLFPNDKKLKFHIGQGMILTVITVVIGIIVFILNSVITSLFTEKVYVFGMDTGDTEIALVGIISSAVINIFYIIFIIFYMIIGISNSKKKENVLLPLIGKYAFYK